MVFSLVIYTSAQPINKLAINVSGGNCANGQNGGDGLNGTDLNTGRYDCTDASSRGPVIHQDIDNSNPMYTKITKTHRRDPEVITEFGGIGGIGGEGGRVGECRIHKNKWFRAQSI